VHPEIGGHYFQAVKAQIIAYEGEREPDIEFVRIISLGDEDEAAKDTRMFQCRRKPGPETPARPYFTVVRPAVVVGAHCGAGCHIAHSPDKACDEEGIVVVLFMNRENQVVEYFAA